MTTSGASGPRPSDSISRANVTVIGPADQVATFVRFCEAVRLCCTWGATRELRLPVDGDGPGSLGVTIDVPVPDLERVHHAIHSGRDPISVGGIGN